MRLEILVILLWMSIVLGCLMILGHRSKSIDAMEAQMQVVKKQNEISIEERTELRKTQEEIRTALRRIEARRDR